MKSRKQPKPGAIDSFEADGQSRTGYSPKNPLENQIVQGDFKKSDEHPDGEQHSQPLDIAKYLKKHFAMKTKNYSSPRIYRGAKEWFVEFYYINPFTGINERYKIRGDLNKACNREEREAIAILLRDGIAKALAAGKKPKQYLEAEANKLELLTVLRTIANSEKLGKSIDTERNYNLSLNRLADYLKEINKVHLLLKDFNDEHANRFKSFLLARGLSNVSVNCIIQPLKSFLKICVKQGKVPTNAFDFVSYLPKHRGSTFIAFDIEEKKAISECLKKHSPELYLFCNIIYCCFARPQEICCLTPEDIDLHNGFIRIRVDTSKVSHTSYRQINDALKQLIIEYNVKGMPKGQYIFTSIMGESDNPKARRKKVTLLWNKLIIKGLKIPKEMYGLKHTGNIDYVMGARSREQVDIIWLQQQNDHTSLETTQKYLRDLGVYKMKREQLPFGLL